MKKIEGFQTKGVVCLRLGYHNTKNGHHRHLLVGVPYLYGHSVEAVRHEIFVVQPAGRTGDCGEDYKENPDIVFEIDAFLSSGEGQHNERDDCQNNSDPLVEIQLLAEDE